MARKMTEEEKLIYDTKIAMCGVLIMLGLLMIATGILFFPLAQIFLVTW